MDEFASNPSKAFVKLNTEQHNILHFVSSLYHVPLQDQLLHYITMMNSFIEVFNSGYLYIRFRQGELIERMNIILDNLETYIRRNSLPATFPTLFKIYINLIIAVSSLHVHNRQLSLNEYLKRIKLIEEVKHLPGSIEYSRFYYNVLMFKDIMDEETVKLYHVRWLDRVNEDERGCALTKSSTTCGYRHIASMYYSLSNYEKSAEFFERALKSEDYSIFISVRYLQELLVSYSKLNNISKIIEVKGKLLNLFTSLFEQTSLQVYVHLHYYKLYWTVLKGLGESKKAIAIHEKMAESVEELGTNIMYDDIPELYKITKHLLELKEHERVVKLANLALVHVKPDNSTHKYVGFCLWKGQALYSMGSLTDANKIFQDLMIFLTEKNLTLSYSKDFEEVCHYLYEMGNYDYLLECYFDDTEVVHDMPIEIYPQIIKLSKESSLSVGQTNDMTRSSTTPLFPFPPTPVDFSKHFRSAYNMIIKYNLVHFVVNFLSVFARLWSVYFLYIVVANSIKRIFYFFHRICEFFFVKFVFSVLAHNN